MIHNFQYVLDMPKGSGFKMLRKVGWGLSHNVYKVSKIDEQWIYAERVNPDDRITIRMYKKACAVRV